MANKTETVFQRAERFLDEWDGVSEPKERAIFRSKVHGITAALDPFGGRDGIVVYPHFATPDVPAHMTEISPSRYAKVALVAQATGSKMLAMAGLRYPDQAEDLRVTQRIDGFAIIDHAHVVMGLALRGETFSGKRPVDDLNQSWDALRFDQDETYALNYRLNSIGLIQPFLDGEPNVHDLTAISEARWEQ